MGLLIRVPNADYSVNNVGLYQTLEDKYIARTGLTDPTQVSACKTFIRSLISEDIISKFSGLWIFAGDTLGKVAPNVVSETLYNLPTLSSGVLSNGLDLSSSTGIDTGFAGSVDFVSNGHLAFYNSTVESNPISFSLSNVANNLDGLGFSLCRTVGAPVKISFTTNGNTPPFTATANTERGLFVGTRLGTSARIYSRGALLQTITRTATTTPPSNLKIGWGGLVDYRPLAKFQVVSFGLDLTDAEVLIYSNACEQLMTDLGR